jgi:two-component system sensor histidine kinase UhpB
VEGLGVRKRRGPSRVKAHPAPASPAADDVAPRARSEKGAPFESASIYRRLVEHIPMMATYMDRVVVENPGMSVPLYISPQIEEMLGYPREAWLNDEELWLQILHPQDADRMVKADEEARRLLRPLSAEYRMIARDGRVVWVSEKSAVVTDEETGTLFWQGVMIDITERKRIEEELTAARRTLFDRTVAAGEEERRRLAADLHDGPVQRLAGIGYVLERVPLQLEHQDLEGSMRLLKRAIGELRTEVERLRRVMTDLRPPVLDEIGLPSAIQDHARAIMRTSPVTILLDVQLARRPDASREIVLYRVAQEALANAVKHSGAERVRVWLGERDGDVVLEVRDDGLGFDPLDLPAAADHEHFGLRIMQERVEMAGGRLELETSPSSGTTVRATVPLAERKAS